MTNLYFPDTLLKYHFMKNRENEGLDLFSQGRTNVIGIILPKNSPLLPILEPTAFQMFEQGITSQLRQNYLWSPSKALTSQDTLMPVSVGQTVLAIATIAGGSVLALAILCIEIIALA